MTDVSTPKDHSPPESYRYGPKSVKYTEGRKRKPDSGGRVQIWGWVSPELYKRIMDDAKANGISRSRQVRLSLAEQYGIDEGDD